MTFANETSDSVPLPCAVQGNVREFFQRKALVQQDWDHHEKLVL